ncbi:hypothetical protein CEUSTIGMA_g763.t1 [Chlamydomonas eustigma]|uniref:Smr domain-containing protein n=1 Tax=Chlamydomonas eustigma TaxID=1157962 RepID=A0A250WRI4_9CHLO|nr:hypothetical protein CEUSTIGMA_g763.t1 [Chlamydomonas eustigma]|eukprot:GAX73309.1 hypothetical protein CEUSTIGMA_g763.t1 [Chlamydomonas eustigma]
MHRQWWPSHMNKIQDAGLENFGKLKPEGTKQMASVNTQPLYPYLSWSDSTAMYNVLSSFGHSLTVGNKPASVSEQLQAITVETEYSHPQGMSHKPHAAMGHGEKTNGLDLSRLKSKRPDDEHSAGRTKHSSRQPESSATTSRAPNCMPLGGILAAGKLMRVSGGVGGQEHSLVTWLKDLAVGDYVLVDPLSAMAKGNKGIPDLPQGFVEEILVEDEYQPKGLLVRLHEDTIGHVVKLLGRRGPEAAAAAAAYMRYIRDKEDEVHFSTLGGPVSRNGTSLRPSGSSASLLNGQDYKRTSLDGKQEEKGGNTAISMAAMTDENVLDNNNGVEEEKSEGWQQWGYYVECFGESLASAILADCNKDIDLAIRTLEAQSELEAAEKMSAMDALIARAVQCASNNAGYVIEAEREEEEARRRSSNQRKQVATAPAGAREQGSEADTGGKGRQGWGSSVGASALGRSSGVVDASARGKNMLSDDSFGPSLSSSLRERQKDTQLRVNGLDPLGQSGPSSSGRKKGGSAGGAAAVLKTSLDKYKAGSGLQRKSSDGNTGMQWPTLLGDTAGMKGPPSVRTAMASPLSPKGASQHLPNSTFGVKLLQRPDSLATAAAQAGLNIRAAESLRNLLPGYSSKAVVDALVSCDGDIESAADTLLASGPPTESEETAAAFAAVKGGSFNKNGLDRVGGFESEDDDLDVTNEGSVDVQQGRASKVTMLVSSFEGLDPDLAEYLLQQCGGDVQRTCSFILEEVLGGQGQSQARGSGVTGSRKQEAPDYRSSAPYLSAAHAGKSAESSSEEAASQGRPNSHRTNMSAVGSMVSEQDYPRAGPQTREATQSRGGSSTVRSRTGTKASAMVPGRHHRPHKTASPVRDSSPQVSEATRLKARLESEKARRVAQVYYDARNVYYQQAAAAYSSGNGRLASEYSRKGKEMGKLAKQYRDDANQAAYKASNVSIHNQYVMDLHHMFVEEALGVLRRTLTTLRALNSPEGMLLKVITGRGNHSINGVPLIKKAVLDYLREESLQSYVDPSNEGVVCVQLGSN